MLKVKGNRARRLRRQRWLIARDRKKIRIGNRRTGRNILGRLKLNELTKQSVKTTSDNRVQITLPKVLDFNRNFEETASHLQCFRSAAQVARHVKHIHFHEISSISPAAALVLASEVDRWQNRAHVRLRADVASWQDNLKRLLSDMGYFELLGLDPQPLPPRGNLVFLRFKRGDSSVKDSGTVAKALRLEIEALVGFSIRKTLLFEGLSEAITNVSQHAYPDGPSHLIKPWWLSASFEAVSRELTVIFYDQGVGIPATLPNWDLFENIKALFNSLSDSQKIEGAMTVGRSSTREEHRGKGLQNFLHFAAHYTPSKLTIFSRRGMYRLQWETAGNAVQTSTDRKDFQNSIGGTLIEWTVTLEQ